LEVSWRMISINVWVFPVPVQFINRGHYPLISSQERRRAIPGGP
jgi:hypothetical protein